TRECVIAVPTVDLLEKVVDIGNCSGKDVDKFARFGLTPLPAKDVQADANDVPDVRVSDPEEGVNLEKSEINAIVSAFARGANGRRNK
ncbi:hypothetical protein, partial [Acetomicrobium sp. S15 = DSM 107314]|uniref:hypothetical protein n=1 Tax=Acetomicrobium sp. S15 = DSM 107314 TaxID=2529858 RepID=UPI0018E1D5D8